MEIKRIKIMLVGHKGKMGSVVFDTLKKDYDVVGFSKEDKPTTDADMVVDFASAESSVCMAKWCAEKNIPLVIGSTGQSDLQMKEILNASKRVPIFIAGNFSVGIKNLKRALEKIVTKDAKDVIVFEKHHRSKKDAPSGTAKEIVKVITDKFGVVANVVFERGGKEIGTHTVDVYYEDEVITISHKVFSREAFAGGVKRAVEYMQKVKKSGLYTMEDINFWQNLKCRLTQMY